MVVLFTVVVLVAFCGVILVAGTEGMKMILAALWALLLLSGVASVLYTIFGRG